ncbi:MAG: SDR family oxidoreductase [Clostridiales bacterium]|nr:SDR family oxidoreductase [Clostridiales bacterium]
MRLQDKVAVVTGASSGVGREIALLFAKEGAKVVAVARRAERLADLEAQSKDLPGEIVAFAGDISVEETNAKMIDFAVEKFGKFDILINNAGVMDNFAPVENLDTELLQRLMAVDVYGPAWATRKAVNVFMKNKTAGSIVNVASIAGICGGKSGCAYTMAKHAVIGLTKNTAFSCRLDNIRCNAICPGGINTEMTNPALFANADQKGLQSAMLAGNFGTRSAEPEEIANVALFLASDEAAVVSGAIVTADSGLTTF